MLAAIFGSTLLCSLRFFWIVDRFAVNLFTWDQWGVNDATVFQQHSLYEIFRWQWGPHRLGMAGVISKLVEPLFGWNTRYEAFGVAFLLSISAVLAMFLKKRLVGRTTIGDVIIPLIFLTPAQYEIAIAGEPIASFAMPIVLVVLLGLSWTIQVRPIRLASVLCLNFLLIFTGYGIFMGPITIVLILLEWMRDRSPHHWWIYLLSLTIASASLGSFFVGYHRLSEDGCSLGVDGVLRPFWFSALMFSHFLGLRTTPTEISPALVGIVLLTGALISALFLFRRCTSANEFSEAKPDVPFAFLAYSLLFVAAAAIGRSCISVGMAQSSRYVTPMIVGFYGLYLAAVTMKNGFWRVLYVSMLWAVALISSARIHSSDWLAITEYSRAKESWRECYLASHDQNECTSRTGFHVTPVGTFINAETLQRKLDYLESHRLNLFAD